MKTTAFGHLNFFLIFRLKSLIFQTLELDTVIPRKYTFHGSEATASSLVVVPRSTSYSMAAALLF